MKRWLLAWLMAAACTSAGATAYSFPSKMPAGCSNSGGGSYDCSSVTLSSGDTIAISGARPANILISGDFDTSNAVINSAGSTSDLNIVVTGQLKLGFQANIKGNVTAGSVPLGGREVVISGNLAAKGGNISLALQTDIGGNLSTSGTGTISTADSGSIGGSVSAGSGSISLAQFSTVVGNVSSAGGAINVGYRAEVNGNLSTSGTISLDQEARVGGNITGGTGNVSVGYAATVVGTLTTSSGSISFAQNAVASACVKSTGSASITLGYESKINSVCCGSSSCGSSCVVNNSSFATPALCAGSTPTLVAGTRYSFESYDVPGSYIRHSGFLGYIAAVSSSSSGATMNDSTFIARVGLSNSACWSFESVNYPGYYLRHNNFILKLNAKSTTAPYPDDATFCLRSGLANASAISFEASNAIYPAYYLQHKTDTSMILATTDGSAAVNGRATFYPRPGWAPAIDHYELSAPSSGLACQASTVTVTACADASSPCTSPVTSIAGQSATLSTSAGTLGSSTVSFDAGGSATTSLTHAAASNGATATVTLSGETLAATSARRCCTDGTSCSAANSCSTTFSTAGFIVAASAGGTAATVPTQTAGVGSGSWVLRAVKTNTSTKACEAALSGSTTVNWGVQCNDPATCSSGSRMTLTGSSAVAVAGNANGSSGNDTAVPMSFDANGNAPFSFSYADVGRVTLLASKAASGSLLAALSGSSNAFVVKPAGFLTSAIRCTSYAAGSCATAAIASPGNNPGAASASGNAFIPAGKPFSATVTATDANGNATPNYGRESTPEGVILSAALVQPAGGNAPALSNPSGFSSFSNGVATGTSFAWPEVGIITLTPAVADGSYLGAGNVTGTVSGNVGRFIPAGFAATAAVPNVVHRVDQVCSAPATFTYLDENFSLGFTLTAQNASGVTTQNYSGAFALLDLNTAARFNLAGISGSTLFKTTNSRLLLNTSSGNWSNGVASVTLKAAALRTSTPDGPFSADFGILPVDPDGVTLLSPDLDTDLPANGVERAKVGTIPLRFGRLRLQNGIAAATRPLNLPLEAQHWSGTAYSTNTLDSCTRVSATNLSFGNLRKALVASDAAMVGSSVTVANGKGLITLAAPAGSRAGTLDVALLLDNATPPVDSSCLKTQAGWTATKAATVGAGQVALRGAWCGAAFRDPSARATWGLYRGADGVVYQRENY